MRLLVLGGTRFLGRHLAQQALAAGHELTLLHRGRSASGLFPEAEHLVADRDREGEFAAALNGAMAAGPFDPTGRFTWWVRRFVRADVGDDDETEVLAPGDPATPVQFIDARDAAAWMLHQAEAGHRGTYNLTGPESPATLGELLAAARDTLAPASALLWVDEAFLLEQGVAPWSELPVWLPTAQSGVHRVDITRALDTGLQCRPWAQTLRDTAAWAAGAAPPAPGGPMRPPVGLAPEREAALRAAWRGR